MNYYINADNRVVSDLNYIDGHLLRYKTLGYILITTPNYIIIDKCFLNVYMMTSINIMVHHVT